MPLYSRNLGHCMKVFTLPQRRELSTRAHLLPLGRGAKRQSQPSPLLFGQGECYEQRCTPCRQSWRKRASCCSAALLSSLSAFHPWQISQQRASAAPKASQHLCGCASN